MLLEAALFAAAAMVHSGLLLRGYEHPRAATAESVIGLVLVAALVLCRVRPEATRRIGRVAQGFALFGTVIGAFTIAVGIGPQSTADIIYHAVLLVVLAAGLALTGRAG